MICAHAGAVKSTSIVVAAKMTCLFCACVVVFIATRLRTISPDRKSVGRTALHRNKRSLDMCKKSCVIDIINMIAHTIVVNI